MNIIQKSKVFFDKIHGYIKVDPIALSIIDTYEFQRLRFIKQTGVVSYVFPTAEHTRFEHSIGTYYLANLLLNNLQNNTPEIDITTGLRKVITIAALTHDLGHVMFSHLFDDLFMKDSDNIMAIHEIRSIVILKNIISKYNLNINEEEMKVIEDLIYPYNKKYDEWDEKFKLGKWIFEIVSNDYSHLDVDKLDYLVRDSNSIGLSYSIDFRRIMEQAKIMKGFDNELHIHYPLQSKDDIKEIFRIRYRLHKNIYNHKAVKGIEIYIIKILEELDKRLNIREYINDMDKILELVDNMILHHMNNDTIRNYFNKIVTRKFPKMKEEIVSNEGFVEIDNVINLDKHYIVKCKIGLINKKENPISLIPFYSVKDNCPKKTNKVGNKKHLEYVTRIYND